MKPALIKALETLVAWVQQDLLPLWRSQVLEPEGWAGAHLDARGQLDPSAQILIGSQAQVAYMLARAEHLGWVAGSQPQVRRLIDFAGRHGTLPCRSDGYVHSLDRQLSILDERHHLTDQALFILGSTAAYAAFGNAQDLRRAYNIFEWLQRRLAHPQAGWFEDSDLPSTRSPRSHFHLLMAFLYLYEISPKPHWLDAAESIVALYQSRFLDADALRLHPLYQKDWTPVTDAWYPEDQFLWIYGLQKFASFSGRSLALASHYHSVCESQALGSNGLFLESVGGEDDCAFTASGTAAAILAGISMMAAGDRKAAVAVERHVQAFFNFCVLKNPRGMFVDRMSARGVPEVYTSAATAFILFDAAQNAARWLEAINSN